MFACSTTLPVYAEGGFFPSLTVIFGLILLYTVGLAVVVTAIVYVVVKLLRRQLRPRIGRMFVVALANWTIGLAVYLSGALDPYMDDFQATMLGLALTFSIAGLVGFRTAIPTNPQ